MPETRLPLSEYKGMWLFALFDLPVMTKEDRKGYTRFRNELLKDGFTMMQFSVYARYCASEEASKAHRKRIKKFIPSAGQVRLMSITDKQFGKMEVFYGKKLEPTEEPPSQMMLF